MFMASDNKSETTCVFINDTSTLIICILNVNDNFAHSKAIFFFVLVLVFILFYEFNKNTMKKSIILSNTGFLFCDIYYL